MKSLLIIVPFDNVYPPMNGGMQRCFHIIHQLAKYFDLTLITFQEKESFLKAAEEYPSIANVKIYSTKDKLQEKDMLSLMPGRLQNALRYRWYKKALMGPADGKFLQYYPALVQLIQRNKYDTILLENLASLNAISIIRKYDKQVTIIYDAHNVDSKLARIGVEKWRMDKKNHLLIDKAETTLYKSVNAILACSNNDLDDLRRMNDNKLEGMVIPNGVNIRGNLFDEGVRKDVPEYILFCGALWSPPNSEGLYWFFKTIWPVVTKSFPNLKLLVVGIGELPQAMHELKNDSSLQFTGAVDDVTPWYNKATVAIVPLLSGSGTRLKILEAMSLGLPVISTSKGAEGINFTNGKDIIIADKEKEFAEALNQLLKDKEERLVMQHTARKLVEEKYDWNVIGRSLAALIELMPKTIIS